MNGPSIRRLGRTTALVAMATGALGGSADSVAAQDAAIGITELARDALDTSRELRAVREGYVTAQEQVSEAWSNVMPSVDLNASYTRNISPAVNFVPARFFDPMAGDDDFIELQFGADNTYNSTFAIEQPLFRPGLIVALGAASRFESLQEEVVRGGSQSVVTDVRLGYYQLLLAQEQVRLTQQSVERVRQSLEETRALNRGGLASDYDVLRLEVELANLEPNLRRAENGVGQARRQLAILVGHDDHEGLTVSGALAEIDLADLESNDPANREILTFMGFGLVRRW